MKIAVCGKGGSGKSTVTALLAGAMLARGLEVIVVDSDESNSGLYRMLGLEAPPLPLIDLVGGKQEVRNVLPKSGPPLPHQQTSVIARPSIRLAEIPSEHVAGRDGLRLVSVGKILHALEGCACPMGVLSREFLRKLALDSGQIAIVDMEAGVEHFGRGIESGVDAVLLVVDPSFESIQLAERVRSLTVGIGIGSTYAVLNRVPTDEAARRLTVALRERNLDVLGAIPYDQGIFEAGFDGGAVPLGGVALSVEGIAASLLSRA
jgi:CO dehydrogenase maturation factor